MTEVVNVPIMNVSTKHLVIQINSIMNGRIGVVAVHQIIFVMERQLLFVKMVMWIIQNQVMTFTVPYVVTKQISTGLKTMVRDGVATVQKMAFAMVQALYHVKATAFEMKIMMEIYIVVYRIHILRNGMVVSLALNMEFVMEQMKQVVKMDIIKWVKSCMEIFPV